MQTHKNGRKHSRLRQRCRKELRQQRSAEETQHESPQRSDVSFRLFVCACKILRVVLWCRYGLLGASGCGKTTLLSCIVGRKRLNSGDIFVLGGRPGTVGSGVPGPRVGYMPQVCIANYFFFWKSSSEHFFLLLSLPQKKSKVSLIFFASVYLHFRSSKLT